MSRRARASEPLGDVHSKKCCVERVMLSDLPLDILALIFAYAPLRGRLCAISVVCKRWRTAALRSITYLQDRSLRPLPHLLLPLLPRLTELDLPHLCFTFPIAISAQLTRLSCGGFSYEPWATPPFPQLQDLCMSVTTKDSASLFALLAKCASSLTRLMLPSGRMTSAFGRCLLSENIPLPRLSSLSLMLDSVPGKPSNEHSSAVLDLLSAQLTSLTLLGEMRCWTPELARMSFPRLRSLTMNILMISEHHLRPFIEQLPQLTELTVFNSDCVYHLPMRQVTKLISFVPNLAITAANIPLLAALPRLKSIPLRGSTGTLRALWPVVTRTYLHMSTRVTELTIPWQEDDSPKLQLDNLYLFSNLRELSLDLGNALPMQPFSFPFLTMLTFDGDCEWECAFRTGRVLVGAAPRLQMLCMHLAPLGELTRDEQLHSLRQFLRELELEGLPEIYATFASPCTDFDQRKFVADFKWLSVLLFVRPEEPKIVEPLGSSDDPPL